MQKKTVRLGLIGKDVSKSTSDKVHTFILSQWGINCIYQKFSVDIDTFDDTMRMLIGDFDGFNVTIPYKRDVLSYLNETVGEALQCGAVNTVLCNSLKGYNTDGVGFLQMLESENVTVKGKKVLILGAGGSGRSVAVTLKNAGATVYMYRRNKPELLETVNELGVFAVDDAETGGFDIVINTTGVGMHDTTGISPVTEKAFLGATCAVDLIYYPKQSQFLSIAKQKGLQTINGEAMLFYQGYYADCLFVERTPDSAEAKKLYEKYLTTL